MPGDRTSLFTIFVVTPAELSWRADWIRLETVHPIERAGPGHPGTAGIHEPGQTVHNLVSGAVRVVG
jgi:hypothetical protein